MTLPSPTPTPRRTTTLPLLAFNDVYRVTQKYSAPAGHATRTKEGEPPSSSGGQAGKERGKKEDEYISVAQFGRTLLGIRDGWGDSSGGEGGKEGLVLFAGDVFNPSVESSVTRGSHMVPIMNALKLDVACCGNHDFDFGYAHLSTLIKSCNFPWLLSNIVDTMTGKQPDVVQKFVVYEKMGVRVGVIGLVEKDWIETIPSWPSTFQHRSMVDTAIELSKQLRDPAGPHKVDLIIALTHCRVPNDIELANQLGAVKGRDVANEHGVDLLIGGHDHMYYIGKGATSWEGFAREDNVRGAEADQGVYLIKSGTDFRDLSEAMLELEEQPAGSVRRQVIKSLTGKHHEITPATPSSPDIENLVKSLLSTVTSTLSNPVCFTFTPFDVRSEKVRTQEMAIGNWVADILLHAYAEMLEETASKSRGNGEDKKDTTDEDVTKGGKGEDKGRDADGRADAVIICGGTLRGDSLYPPGKITLGDILEIMPFDDPVVCLEIDGKGIHDVLESALSKWPAQEGRFPVIAGLRVKWDHTKSPGQRIASVHLVKSAAPNGDDPEDEYENPEDLVKFFEQEDGTRVEVRQRAAALGEEIKRDDTSRTYRVITRNYMAEGYDGFEALKNRKFIVDDDNGQIMSSIVRSFLLGSAYIFRHKQIRHEHRKHLSARTDKVISRARRQWSYDAAADHLHDHHAHPGPNGLHSPTTSVSTLDDSHMSSSPVASSILSPGGTPRRHVVAHSNNDIRDALHVARHDHMSDADCFDGASLRAGKFPNDKPSARSVSTANSGDVPKAAFMVDDSNREEVRALDGELAIVSPLIDGRLMDVSADKP